MASPKKPQVCCYVLELLYSSTNGFYRNFIWIILGAIQIRAIIKEKKTMETTQKNYGNTEKLWNASPIFGNVRGFNPNLV